MLYPWQTELWERLRALGGRIPHAMLIHGPRGIGKLALAEHLAQRLLCESDQSERAPCGACEGCRWFLAGTHPDVRRVEPEALARRLAAGEPDESLSESAARPGKPSVEIKIEQVRALEGFLNLRSHRGGRRVALVHPAEAMNANAANALLKSLEEPAGSAFFVLISHQPARLLPTIRSRCVALPIPPPPAEAALGWLREHDVRDPGRWLAYASGAPVRAGEYAGAAGLRQAQLRQALDARDRVALSAPRDRDEMEELAEAVQKFALDRVFATYFGRGKYASAKPSRDGMAWLRYARRMGRSRALSRHPLNPSLFAEEMLSGMPPD